MSQIEMYHNKTYYSETYQNETYHYENNRYKEATKGPKKRHLLHFLHVVIEILVNIIVNICNYCSFSRNCSSFIGFISNNCIKRSENSHLAQNVDALDICKRPKKRHLPELLHILILKLVHILCQIYKHLSACILLNKLAYNVHGLIHIKNKPYFFR